jgi:tRNA nucleotidyltransferase/poly(A) polymerase
MQRSRFILALQIDRQRFTEDPFRIYRPRLAGILSR